MTPLNGPALEKAARENYKLECADIDVEPTPWDVLDEGLKELYRLQVTRGVTAYRDALPQSGVAARLLKWEGVLVDCAQFIDAARPSYQQEGCWSEWDQQVRDRITEALKGIAEHRAAVLSGVELPGWRLVPVEPTREICLAGWAPAAGDDPLAYFAQVYRSMIAAAPPPRGCAMRHKDSYGYAMDLERTKLASVVHLADAMANALSAALEAGASPHPDGLVADQRRLADKWAAVKKAHADYQTFRALKPTSGGDREHS